MQHEEQLVFLRLVMVITHNTGGIFSEQVGPTCLVIPPLAYLDDVMFIIEDDSSDRLLTRLVQLADAVSAGARLHGLRVNFGPNKSEAVVACYGQGLLATRLKLASLCDPDAGHVVSQLQLQCGSALRLVSQYKHLGVM